MRRRALKRRYGHRGHMYGGQRIHVTVKSAAGTPLEKWGGTAFAYDQPADVALRVAANRPSGTIVEIRERDLSGKHLVYRYRVGRVAGLPSVTRLKKGEA